LITANDLGFLSDTMLAELDKESEIVRRKLARLMAKLKDGR